MAKTTQEVWTVGRRKRASARVRLRPGSGEIKINGRAAEQHFPNAALRGYLMQPFELTGTGQEYDLLANISGGGLAGHAGALRHGIARALAEARPELRSVLKESGMLRRDPREKERKKYGQPGARKKFQFSKR